MSHAPRSLTLQTRLNWTEAGGCAVEGVEGTTLRFGYRRKDDDPYGYCLGEALVLAGVEMATLHGFLSYAHSAGISVRSYASRSEAVLSLTGGGRSRVTEFAVFPEVEVASAEEVEPALRIFVDQVRNHQVAVSPPVRPPDAAAQLIKLR